MRRTVIVLAMISGFASIGRADDAPDRTGRDFPKTLNIDDPGIDDETSLPVISAIRHGATATSPGFTDTTLAFELDKRITERLDIQITTGWTSLSPGGDGWDPTGLTLKYVLDDEPERMASFGVARTFGGSGATRVGSVHTGVTEPTLYGGQGFGLLPDSVPGADWLRPVAITGTLSYGQPDAPQTGAPARVIVGGTLQYSLDILASRRPDIIPEGLRRLIPIVEVTASLPTTRDFGHEGRQALVAPGLIYAGSGYQLGVEAQVPMTRATGTSVGVIARLDIFFSGLGVAALSRPLF